MILARGIERGTMNKLKLVALTIVESSPFWRSRTLLVVCISLGSEEGNTFEGVSYIVPRKLFE